jgi:hypothetical protein
MASDQDLRDFSSTSQDYFNRRSSPLSDTTRVRARVPAAAGTAKAANLVVN